ncbi:aminotransferase class I/II-fold pyridoxal phosphate-dependent enzyme [Deferribacter autotrophicus]|uniref:Aminotransferase class I/II-fold pyridoxal phosphate-dependent enzyme n=1 Tax=Deferribacter autotrophicus TaxID=500465 RepID=A0A5A8F6D4_9BACT|nr:aminotransferase class I/II-fold pyridoxal phosphate-dependent enzyme [Deferribacter autotrophicus]KAA0258983.1 aminotransferase class I/II-fold pyridoxal phosphate-dependent enzyme [Deferribacter autotrophicus]
MSLFNKVYNFKDAEQVRQLGLYPYFRVIESEQNTEVIINGKKVLMLGSNSYLGLTNHPKVKEAAINAIKKYGTGCAGSRFLNGTLDIHIELEEELADFVGKEAAILYSTGFQANQGAIAPLVGRNEYVIIDKLVHASIIEGCRLTLGKMLRFNHNDMESLENKLSSIELERGKLVVVDGVYSMEGDLADLPNIVKIAKKYNAEVMVDDAHGIGVFGTNGRGTCDHFGLTDDVALIMGTFSKSFASLGGFIASSKEIIDYLKHSSRALIFSASMSPANAAAVKASLEILKNEPERIEKLWANTHRLRKGLQELGLDTGNSVSPIIPVQIGTDLDVFKVCMMLLNEGVFVNPVVTPAVEPGKAIIRLSVMATHTFEQIDFALEKIEKVTKQLGVLV